MLKKLNRFHGHQSVRRAYRQGRPVRGTYMSLHSYTEGQGQHTKAAVVVSRKVDKSAVKRNRVRRRIYEQVRLQLADFKNPVALVFTVYKPEIAELTSEQLVKEINGLLSRSRTL